MTIRICVKGNEKDGNAALAQRGIHDPQLVRVTEHNTFWDVPDLSRPSVIRWFCEPEVRVASGGFPVGTLLHHN